MITKPRPLSGLARYAQDAGFGRLSRDTAGCLRRALDKMRARRCRLERVGEILRFARHQPVAEFHDAYRIRRCAVIAENEFGDPQIAAPDNSPDREALRVRLHAPALLDVAPAAD